MCFTSTSTYTVVSRWSVGHGEALSSLFNAIFNPTVELVRNLMAHAQKPDFVFRRNGRVHLNRREIQFSRLLAAEVCASALIMPDTPRSEVVWGYWLPTPFASFPFSSPTVRYHVPPHSERSIPQSKGSKINPTHQRGDIYPFNIK
jgi:hypothetical protein